LIEYEKKVTWKKDGWISTPQQGYKPSYNSHNFKLNSIYFHVRSKKIHPWSYKRMDINNFKLEQAYVLEIKP
jgi:hypothetical protein